MTDRDTDFVAWVDEQVAVLRRLHETRANDIAALDLEGLADEVEDMGRSEFHAVASLVEQCIAHLLKLAYSPLVDPRRHWHGEVRAFRLRLKRRLTATLHRKLAEARDDLWDVGRQLACNAMRSNDPDIERHLPDRCPWTLDQILGLTDPPFFPQRADAGAASSEPHA